MTLHELPSRCDLLDSHRSDPIVVVSSGGVRARLAALELMLAGFTEVSALSGGMDRWSELRLPIEVEADSGPDHVTRFGCRPHRLAQSARADAGRASQVPQGLGTATHGPGWLARRRGESNVASGDPS